VRGERQRAHRLRRAVDIERARTAEQIEALQRSFADIVEAAELTSTDDEHDPEARRSRSGPSYPLLHQASEELAALDSARKLIDDGTIESCTICGGPIGLSRLLALPSVRTCITCAS
jgi:RNA polymerase-binding transcription factor DksA